MNKNEANFTHLPYEVICHILSFLTYTDRRSLRLVCKQFYLATTEKRDIKREFFIIKDSSAQNVIKILSESTRQFLSFEFRKVDFTDDLMTTFDKYNKILNLNLIECNIDEKYLTIILLRCSSLRTIVISSCKSLFMPGVLFSNIADIYAKGFDNLKSVTFDNNSYLSDNILERFVRLCPNLDSVSFKGTAISFHPGLCKRFYTENYSIENPANSVLTIIYICNIFESFATNIKHLDFSNTNINGEALEKLCTLENLELESLFVARCNEVRKSFVLKLGDWQPYLIYLDLSYCKAINNDSFQNICENMPNLVYLNIECCNNINNDGIGHLRNLKKLTDLNISDCQNITSTNIQYYLENCTLKEFHCQNIQINESDINPPVFLKHVKCLDLSYSDITDNILSMIFTYCREIETLILFRCKKITDNGLMGDYNYSDKYEPISSINNLQKLKYINLDFCNINDAPLIMSFNLPDLRHCILNSTKVSHAGISSLVTKCNRLEVLSLNDCYINNECIEKIVHTLRRLHTLSLVNCRQLDMTAVDYIINNCKILKELNISGCSSIPIQGIHKLSMLCSIQKLHHSMYSLSANGQFLNFPAPPCLPIL